MQTDVEAKTDETRMTSQRALPTDILLLIFVHGFKGTDTTFGSFPSRLQHVLSETIENVIVESVVFPAYETKGELDKAVIRFADWLTTLTVEKEVAHGAGGGAGKAKIVLCGHSMGGLLIADSLLAFVHTRPDKNAPIWPNIIACLAFDTPYYGLNPHVFKNSATKAAGYMQTAHKAATDIWGAFDAYSKSKSPGSAATPPKGLLPAPEVAASTSPWAKWMPAAYTVGGALVAGAAAGTAFYKRDEIGSGYAYLQDHMKYVGNLWDEKAMGDRVAKLMDVEQDHGILFRTYYTAIPPNWSTYLSSRTFVILPTSEPAIAHFQEARNTLAPDEVQAHISMFEPSTNDGYYQLGLSVAGSVREALMKGRGILETGEANAERVAEQSEEFSRADEGPVNKLPETIPDTHGEAEEPLL